MEDHPGVSSGTVAIVGLSCHFCGALDLADLHELTLAGRRMFRPLPPHPSTGRTLHGALLDGWAPACGPYRGGGAEPDPGPVHKLSAETIGMALADARVRDLAMPAGRTGRTEVIVASTTPDLPGAELSGLLGAEFGIGGAVERASAGDPAGATMAAAGPPAAYLSSLHALCTACTLLTIGKASVVVAGGAEVGVSADWLTRQAAAGLLGTTEMRVYDADPAGMLPGDGCGIVALMSSASARAAGLPVYAEIIGWGVVPRAPDQAGPALRRIYERAGIDPDEVRLIEGAGAGTATGDLAELSGLADLRQGGRTAAALGAVSASLGYLGGASGVASLIKAVAAMVAGVIPPGSGCARPHRLIESGAALLRLPDGPEPWHEGARLSAVNSPGTADPAVPGAHLILRRAPEPSRGSGRRRRAAGTTGTTSGTSAAASTGAAPDDVPRATGHRATGHRATGHRVTGDGTFMAAQSPVPPPRMEYLRTRASAPSVFALCGTAPSTVAATLDMIALGAREPGGTGLADLARQMAGAATQAARRGAPIRLALTADDPDQLVALASRAAWLLRRPLPALTTETGIAIGSGASGTVTVAFAGLALTPAEHSSMLAAGLAGVRALDRLGITPAAAAGYSLGELTGLVWAGCLSPAEAARFAAQRGHLLRGCGAQPAVMTRVAADAELVTRLCELHHAQIVAYEAPAVHLVSGSAAGIRELAAQAVRLGGEVEPLPAALPLHTPAMSRCAAPLRVLADSIPILPARRTLVSTVSGQLIGPADDIAGLLAMQPARPVMFSAAIAIAARAADLVVVTRPAAPASPASHRTRLDAIAAQAAGLPAITLPDTLPPAGTADGALSGSPAADWAPVLATLFAAGALTDLPPLLTEPAPLLTEPDARPARSPADVP